MAAEAIKEMSEVDKEKRMWFLIDRANALRHSESGGTSKDVQKAKADIIRFAYKNFTGKDREEWVHLARNINRRQTDDPLTDEFREVLKQAPLPPRAAASPVEEATDDGDDGDDEGEDFEALTEEELRARIHDERTRNQKLEDRAYQLRREQEAKARAAAGSGGVAAEPATADPSGSDPAKVHKVSTTKREAASYATSDRAREKLKEMEAKWKRALEAAKTDKKGGRRLVIEGDEKTPYFTWRKDLLRKLTNEGWKQHEIAFLDMFAPTNPDVKRILPPEAPEAKLPDPVAHRTHAVGDSMKDERVYPMGMVRLEGAPGVVGALPTDKDDKKGAPRGAEGGADAAAAAAASSDTLDLLKPTGGPPSGGDTAVKTEPKSGSAATDKIRTGGVEVGKVKFRRDPDSGEYAFTYPLNGSPGGGHKAPKAEVDAALKRLKESGVPKQDLYRQYIHEVETARAAAAAGGPAVAVDPAPKPGPTGSTGPDVVAAASDPGGGKPDEPKAAGTGDTPAAARADAVDAGATKEPVVSVGRFEYPKKGSKDRKVKIVYFVDGEERTHEIDGRDLKAAQERLKRDGVPKEQWRLHYVREVEAVRIKSGDARPAPMPAAPGDRTAETAEQRKARRFREREVLKKWEKRQERRRAAAADESTDDPFRAMRDGIAAAHGVRPADAAGSVDERPVGLSAVQPTARPGVAGWLDWILGRTPPRTAEAEVLLNSKESFSRDDMRAMEALTHRAHGFDQMAKERGVSSWFGKVREAFKGAGTGILIGATAVTVFSALTAGAGGIAAAALIPKLFGVAAGSLTSAYVRNLTAKSGKPKFLLPLILGSLAGIGTGALVGNIDSVIQSVQGLFASNAGDTGTAAVFAGEGNAGRHAGSLPPIVAGDGISEGVPGSVPPPPEGLTPRDFCIIREPIISGDASVWSTLVDGMKSVDMLNASGRESFAHALHNVVDRYDMHELLFDGEDYPWRGVPDGTQVQFGDLFSDPRFVSRLTEEISRNYPSLAQQIASGEGVSVRSFIQGLGYMYGAR